jgi:hypothetical protein
MVRFYLMFSAAGLFLIALSYGVAPGTVLPMALDVTIEGTDLTHIFRGVMGLYLGLIVLWVLGAMNPKLAPVAITSEIVFMLGLALGRSVSVVVDGIPSVLLLAYAILEVVMGIWGIIIMRRFFATSVRT